MRENAEGMVSVDPGEERLGGSTSTSGKKVGKTESNFSVAWMESKRKQTQAGT